MKKNKIKNDLLVLKKMDNEEYKQYIKSAYETCINLNILSEVEFIIYQLCLENLKKVTFEEINSYKRLLDLEYFESLKLLKNELSKNDKIINFPKKIS